MKVVVLICLIAFFFVPFITASSHSEAPNTVGQPQSDGTDFYAFRSYETGREEYITFILNLQPLQNPFAGPNYYSLSSSHFYEIYVDNNGDAVEDFTLQLYYGVSLAGPDVSAPIPKDTFDCFDGELPNVTTHTGFALEVGPESVGIPLKQYGAVTANGANLNWIESYYINAIFGERDSGTVVPLTHDNGNDTFIKPFDNAGNKTFPSSNPYASYASKYIFTIDTFTDGSAICNDSRVFVGQRLESFSIALGAVFDLINFVPIAGFPGAVTNSAANNVLSDKNVDSIVIEIPIQCAVNANGGSDGSGVIGTWTAIRQLTHDPETGDHVPGEQVSRLGSPLVNELVIGLRDKGKFNKNVPSDDAANGFGLYVTNPTFPAIISLLFLQDVNSQLGLSLNTLAPDVPRNDLVAAFLTGIKGLNQPTVPTAGEMLRLNTGIAPTAYGSQNTLGVIGGDYAGFPNGRRLGDDIVDIVLRVAIGVLCAPPFNLTCGSQGGLTGSYPPVYNAALLDGSPVQDIDFGKTFPYMNAPLGGSDFGAGGRTII